MGSNGTEKIPVDSGTEGSETAIEIKIKTLDSQTYTLKVDKQMPVPVLKEQIASVTGVLSERQRLICRGRVLKDDQLLSAYHVDDGHTLHLVVRQPDLPSPGSLPSNSATDPISSASHGHSNQIAPGVFIEMLDVPSQGDVPPEINRIISAVLGSIGLSNTVSGSEGINVREANSQGLGRTSGSSGMPDSSRPQPEQTDRSRYTFGFPTAVSLGSLQSPVIPDSLTTLSQYLSHIRHEFDAIVQEGENNVQVAGTSRNNEIGSNSSSRPGSAPDGISSPASLAEVLLSTRQMFVEQASECLLQLASQLENQANVTDHQLRSSAQSRAWRTGFLFYNLGAFLLELGRTTMTLRLGQSPSEAVVNGGPAVFISPSGPNHIMVQPLPFQAGASFGAVPVGAAQSGSGLGSGLGSSSFPRRIDIQIRRGTSVATPNVNLEERGDAESASVLRNPSENSVNQAASRLPEDSLAGESGVRIVPIRTMVAAVPGPLGRPPSESSGNPIGLYYPVIGRFQHVSSGHGNSEPGSLPSSQHHASLNFASAQHSLPGSTVPRQSIEDPSRNGSLPIPSTRQELPNARSVNINIPSAAGAPDIQESEREIPGSLLQVLRAVFPEINEEDVLQGTTAGSASGNAEISRGIDHVPEAESRVSDEAIFLSHLIREIMPFISPQAGGNASQDPTVQSSSEVGTSRRQDDPELDSPSPKRQKME